MNKFDRFFSINSADGFKELYNYNNEQLIYSTVRDSACLEVIRKAVGFTDRYEVEVAEHEDGIDALFDTIVGTDDVFAEVSAEELYNNLHAAVENGTIVLTYCSTIRRESDWVG